MKKKQEKSVKRVFLFFLVAILVLGGMFIYREISLIKESNFAYNGVDFSRVNANGLIRYRFPIYVNNAQVPFYAELRNNPKDLDYITYDPSVKELVIGKKNAYVSMDKNSTGISVIAYTTIKQFLADPELWGINTTGTFTEAVGKYIVKTCSDANGEDAVILFEVGNEDKIYKRNECVVLETSSEDNLIKVAERFDLILLGVVK
ncbi:MAG: hypothetical protein AABW87_03605 [Nanoarchaeota archaeon]